MNTYVKSLQYITTIIILLIKTKCMDLYYFILFYYYFKLFVITRVPIPYNVLKLTCFMLNLKKKNYLNDENHIC